jgi:hypothetical protein
MKDGPLASGIGGFCLIFSKRGDVAEVSIPRRSGALWKARLQYYCPEWLRRYLLSVLVRAKRIYIEH